MGRVSRDGIDRDDSRQKRDECASDVSLFVLHQANVRIIKHAMVNLGVPEERVFCNLDVYGNTSGGSIPIALDEAVQQGRLNRGDNVMLCGFGAGLTWGTGLYRW